MERRRRIAAYGLCYDNEGRVLLVRAATGYAGAGRWCLPGGGVDHGQHPEDAVIREVEEETGLRVAVKRPRDVLTDIERLPMVPAWRHQDRIIFDVKIIGGELRDEREGSSDRAAWVSAEELVTLPLMPLAARVLGTASPDEPTEALVVPGGPTLDSGPVVARRQRFAAYGLVTDAAGNVLLTRIADGYPGAGRWHLPGGGTDFGEAAVDAFLRELIEETGQHGRVVELLGVSHRHTKDALGPEGMPIDWHGVRVVYSATVDEPTPPRVMEDRGGSTAAAEWFAPSAALRLPLTEIAHDMISTRLPAHP